MAFVAVTLSQLTAIFFGSKIFRRIKKTCFEIFSCNHHPAHHFLTITRPAGPSGPEASMGGGWWAGLGGNVLAVACCIWQSQAHVPVVDATADLNLTN